MEIAFLVIAVVGLLALGGGGGRISGGINVAPPAQPPQDLPPQPYTPTLSPTAGPPMVPSTGVNINNQLFSGSAQIGTQVSTQAVKSTGLSGVGLSAATAGIAVGAGIIVGLAESLLAAHKARLQGAKNENAAVDQYVPVFDSFISSLLQAYNSRQITAAQAASTAQQFDRYIYNAFKSLVGAPGTAWRDEIGGPCDKGCTVGCCVYYGDIGPVLNDISFVLGFPTGKWGAGDWRISGRTVTVPKVYPSKYSPYTRAQYTITFQ